MSTWTNKRPIDLKRFTKNAQRTLQRFIGAKNDDDAINYALASGIKVGKRADTQLIRTYTFLTQLYNEKIAFEKDKAVAAAAAAEEARREKLRVEAKARQNAAKRLARVKARAIKRLAKTPFAAAIKRRLAKPQFVAAVKVGTIRWFNKYRIEYSAITDMRNMYNAIKESIANHLPTTSFISLFFMEGKNLVRAISIRITDMRTFEGFVAAIEKITSGNFVGSDSFDNISAPLNMNRWDIATTEIARGFGAAEKMMYKTIGISSSTFKKNGKDVLLGNCGHLSVRHLIRNLERVTAGGDHKPFQSLESMRDFIKLNHINIDILSNSFVLKRPHNEIVAAGEQKSFMIPDKKRKGMLREHIGSSFKLGDDCDVAPVTLSKGISMRPTNPLPWLVFIEKRGNHPDSKKIEIGYAQQLAIPWDTTGIDFETDEYVFINFYKDGMPYSLTKEERVIESAHKYEYENVPFLGSVIYDEVNEHFDVIDGELRLVDGLFMTMESNIVRNNEVIFKPKQLNTNNRVKGLTRDKFIFFDYETVIDFTDNSCMKAYSLSILVLTPDELENLEMADRAGARKAIDEIRGRCCMTFLGYDCSEQFIRWLLENENGIFYTLIGYNNTNFDNFILLDALLRYQENAVEIGVSEIFYNGSQLFNFKISGRHQTFDIHKHLMGSLADNCASFKINCCAKKSFDHDHAQSLHEDGKLLDFITDNNELKEYNEFDVLATAVLFHKYRAALEAIPATKEYAKDLHQHKTIGSLIYKIFEKHRTAKDYKFPKLTYKQYDDLYKHKVAGRVEMFNGVQKIEERLASTDVCSLYPYVLAVLDCYYPHGELVQIEEYMGDEQIGFYYCDIDQSNLKAKNLPLIYPKKSAVENDWSHCEILKDYLISNVMIRLLRRHGCRVEVKGGFYFTEKAKSCDMFGFLLDFMKAKNEQDGLKKSPEYNSALRETLKLLMNSLSGKVIEGLHTEKTTGVDSLVEYEKLAQKAVAINCINQLGGKIFVTYEQDAEKTCESSQRPVYLGVLCYDHAKEYMFNYSYSKVGLKNLIYTDTDASKMRYKDFIEWRKYADKTPVPHWPEVENVDPRYKDHKIYEPKSKVFGSFEDELDGMTGEAYTFYCLQKKSWCYVVDGEEKYRFKGLNDRSILMSGAEPFLERKGEQLKIKPDKAKDVWAYAIAHKDASLGAGNAGRFFDKLYTEKQAPLLCCSFRKIVKNGMRGVGVDETDRFNASINRIKVSYMLKTVKL